MAQPAQSPWDSEVLARCRQGEERAWSELYAAHFDFVYRCAWRLGADPSEVEDICQEVFVVAFRKLSSFLEGRFSTWLYRMVANIVADRHRQRRLREGLRRLFGREPAVAPPPLRPDRAFEAREDKAVVDAVLWRMGARKREVLVLFENRGAARREGRRAGGVQAGDGLVAPPLRAPGLRADPEKDGAHAVMRDEREGQGPRRLVEERPGSETARLLASVARPVAVPSGARQRVVARARARWHEGRRGWRLVAVAGAAVALLAWWAVRGSGTAEPFARVASTEGEVRIEEPGRSVAAAEAGAAVGDGTRLTTGAGGGAAVRFADLELRLGRATAAILSRRGSGGVEIALERGEVSLVVGRRPPDRPVVVGAAGYSVVVVGTVFAVRASADGAVDVTVTEGRVRVTGPGAERLVGAGEVWSSRARAAAAAPAPPSPPAPAAAAPSAPAPIARAPSPRTRSPERPQRLAVARDKRARPARAGCGAPPAPRRTARSPGCPSLSAAPFRSRGVTRISRPAAPAAQDGYEEAQALAARGRYAQAAASFARLSAAGPRAELALYERGLLLLKKLDEPEQARRVFLEHRRRFPESDLGPEVDVSLIEASLRARELPDAAREIDAFLARYPSNERRDELRLHRANLARDGGDCARAERDYQALARGAGTIAEEALHAWAYCRRRLGDEAGARERLREYLRRFPSGRHRGDVEQALGAGR